MSNSKNNSSSFSNVAMIGGIAAAFGAGVYVLSKVLGERDQCSNPPQQHTYTSSPNRRAHTHTVCSICWDELNVTFLPCGHPYHPECIRQWKNEKRTCPLCRASF